MGQGVLCAGSLVVDILTRPLDSQIRWDATTWVDEIQQSLGGNGANTAFALARLGARVRVLGAVGQDAFGDFVVGALASAGADTSWVRRADAPTAASTVLVRTDGARALLNRPGASRVAFSEPIDFTAGLIAGFSHFHLANVFGLPSLRPYAAETLARARRAGLVTSLDTGWDARNEWLAVVGPCLAHADYLFVNQDEARMLAGTDDPAAVAQFFRDRGVTTVVVKLGAQGCAVSSAGGSFHSPAFAVPTVDTTGAGDCFTGAFLALLAEGAPLATAARWANAAGALSVQALGATAGLLDRAATESWIMLSGAWL